jgi:hypothetical protein
VFIKMSTGHFEFNSHKGWVAISPELCEGDYIKLGYEVRWVEDVEPLKDHVCICKSNSDICIRCHKNVYALIEEPKGHWEELHLWESEGVVVKREWAECEHRGITCEKLGSNDHHRFVLDVEPTVKPDTKDAEIAKLKERIVKLEGAITFAHYLLSKDIK